MWIRNTNILLTLAIQASDQTKISVFDQEFNPLPTTSTCQNNIINVEILTYMPNQVLLVLSGPARLSNMWLAGIKVKNDKLLNVLEYKPSAQSFNSPGDYINNVSTKTLDWTQPGCVLINLFNPNPFAYHMYIGNKISF